MGFLKKGASAVGKLVIVAILGVAFVAGLTGVVYLSLQGSEVKVPEIVGKNFEESERELEALGLRIKKRADRYSTEAPNTVLEQLPRPGDTVKTGQLILVVTSKPNAEGEEKPATLQKGNTQQDDSETIEELISDKPKKSTNSNSNTAKKKGSATRDVDVNNSNTATNTGAGGTTDQNNSSKPVEPSSGSSNKQGAPSGSPKPTPAKPTPAKPTGPGDTRERRIPND